MTSENTEQTPGENIEENNKNLTRSENPEQQTPLATYANLCKQPEGNEERFSPGRGRFPEMQTPPSRARICTTKFAKNANLDSSPEKHARGRSMEKRTERKKEVQAVHQVALHRHHQQAHHIHPVQLSSTWMEVNSTKNCNASDIDFLSIKQALQQTIVLIGQAAHSVTSHRRNTILSVLLKDSRKASYMISHDKREQRGSKNQTSTSLGKKLEANF